MKNIVKLRDMSLFKTIGLVLTLGASITACSQTTTWKEEVLLHDGQKIIATRTVERGGKSEIGQQAPIKQQSVAFTMPVTNEKIVWEDKFTEDIGGANFLPMQLEVHKGVAYVVAYPMGCLSYNKWGRPNPPYVLFKHDGHEWQRISLQALPVEFKTVNVVLSIQKNQAQELTASRVTFAQTIADANRRSEIPEFRSILREPLAKERINEKCMEMVYYKGSWVGPGDSIGKRMLDSKSK